MIYVDWDKCIPSKQGEFTLDMTQNLADLRLTIQPSGLPCIIDIETGEIFGWRRELTA